MMTTSVALVTTAWLASSSRDSSNGNGDAGGRHADVMSSFLLYHASIGIAKIFVFFDGDRESQLQVTALHPQVQELHAAGRIELYYRSNGDDAHARYASCVSWCRLRDVAANDVAARQMLNAELAMQLCLTHNRACEWHRRTPVSDSRGASAQPSQLGELRWLLHLDIDELLYLESFARASPPTTPADALAVFVTHLEMTQTQQLTIANYEAVPTQLYGGNYFASATRFRRHHTRVPLSGTAQQRLAFWRERSRHAHFFLFYDNGKSIVRVQEHVAPASVHHWHSVEPDGTTRALADSKSNFYDARRDVPVLLEPTTTTNDNSNNDNGGGSARASVLHYPVCGLEWLRDKYERLGRFPDVWGGRASTERPLVIAPCFHTHARDVVTCVIECPDANSERAIEMLFRSQVLLDLSDDASMREWREQVAAGVGEDIRFPTELLAGLSLDAQQTPRAGPTGRQQASESSDSTRNAVTSFAPPPVPVAQVAPQEFTVEKAWMLAAISHKYL